MVSFNTVISGELAGSATAVQMPSVSCLLVKFKAESDNAGKVYIGGSTNVTKADGTTDATTGFSLAAAEESPWLLVPNLSVFWRVCDNAGDDLTYIGFST